MSETHDAWRMTHAHAPVLKQLEYECNMSILFTKCVTRATSTTVDTSTTEERFLRVTIRATTCTAHQAHLMATYWRRAQAAIDCIRSVWMARPQIEVLSCSEHVVFPEAVAIVAITLINSTPRQVAISLSLMVTRVIASHKSKSHGHVYVAGTSLVNWRTGTRRLVGRNNVTHTISVTSKHNPDTDPDTSYCTSPALLHSSCNGHKKATFQFVTLELL